MSLGSNVETNNLNTCTSANLESRVKAAMPIKDISVVEFGVPKAGVASSGDTKDSVSFGGWNEMLPNTQYPINQQIVAGEPAMSQDRRATDVQWSYIECDGLNITRSEIDWQFDCIADNGISGSVKKVKWNRSNAESLELEMNVVLMKQCVERESTSVAMVTEGIRL